MKRFALLVLSVWAGLAVILSARSQSITTIFNFTGNNGAYPYGSLTLGLDRNFYGTTLSSGAFANGNGTVFQVTTNGLLTTLVSFSGYNGAAPWDSLILGPDGSFYGTTESGGSANDGTVFGMTTNGTFTMVVNLNGSNGASPMNGLTLGADGNFYGVTHLGGNTNLNGGQGYGSVFKVTTNGTLTTLINFDGTNGGHVIDALTLGPDGNFYDTTQPPFGLGGAGTVFRVTTNGTLTTLVNFYNNGTIPEPGFDPEAGLALGPDGKLYGMTSQGGSNGYGTVFQVTTNGTLTTLANFTNARHPAASLTLGPDGNFYGTTLDGGSAGHGAVFKVTTNGTLTTLVSFNGTNGALSIAGLTLGPDANFYGATGQGGSAHYGTIFKLQLPPDFITSPNNMSVTIGGSATFSCLPFGTAPFGYQWLSNGLPMAGATNNSFTVQNVSSQSATNAQFQVVVTNAWGSVTSSAVSLTLPLPPKISAISSLNGGNCTLILQSQPNSTNRLWATTNITINQWQVIATNVTDSNGLAQYLDTNTAGTPQKFYRLSNP
jgi:uncharacterized repeat protein (TIGR03803 family)